MIYRRNQELLSENAKISFSSGHNSDRWKKEISAFSVFRCRDMLQSKREVCSGTNNLVSSVDLAGTKAAGANIHRLRRAVDDSLDSSDVGLERSVDLTVGMRNGTAENKTLSANTALCHVTDTSCDYIYRRTHYELIDSYLFKTRLILYHNRFKKAILSLNFFPFNGCFFGFSRILHLFSVVFPE